MTLDPDYVTKAERERRQQTAQKETKVAKTISIPISYWALLDQVKNKLGKKNVNETLMYCIKEIGIGEGIESWQLKLSLEKSADFVKSIWLKVVLMTFV